MKFLQAIVVTIFAISSHANAQHGGGQEVGNGGDPLHLMFRKARVDSVQVLRTFAVKIAAGDAVRAHFKPDVYEFLLDQTAGQLRHNLIASDIAASEHLFFDPTITDIEQSTCARTNIPGLPATTIRFSLPYCRTALTANGEDYALKVLIHESIHHFGIGGSTNEEAFAWDVAEQLFGFWQTEQAISGPHWKALPLAVAPSARYESATATLDNGMFIWGGCNYSQLPHRESCEKFLGTGAILSLNSAGPTWQELPNEDAPSGRKQAKAVFTGNHEEPALSQKIIVYGGCTGTNSACEHFLSDGGVFDVKSKSWQQLPEVAGSAGRIQHTVVWTGADMIVYGGLGAGQEALSDLWLLSLNSDQTLKWTHVPVPTAYRGRYGHTATWTGAKMIVFGGCAQPGLLRCREKLKDGFSFDPVTKSFSPIPEALIDGRLYHSAIWTGTDLIIWGGQKDFNAAHNDGAILHLDGEQSKWTEISAILPQGEASGRYHHQASWTGSSMLVYGGEATSGNMIASTLSFRYLEDEPTQQSWSLVDTKAVPIARKGHAQAWLDGYLVIWGGYGDDHTFLPTGAILTKGR
jgi:N-acetylneuraminic acid mutarotase